MGGMAYCGDHSGVKNAKFALVDGYGRLGDVSVDFAPKKKL